MVRFFDDDFGSPRDGAPARSRFARTVVAVAALALLVGVGGCGDKGVEVPGVVGLTLDEARTKLTDAGFETELGDPELTNDKPADTVVAQEPAEKAKADKGSAVVLKVTAKDRVKVPAVTGLPLEEATAKLGAAGLEAELGDAEHTNSRPPGTVLRQEPAPGSQADKGGEVTLTVAARDVVRVPKVTGALIAAAESELKAAGLVPVRGKPVLRADVPQGIVVEQNPAVNAEVARGKQVTLAWSADGEKVPKIVGKRLLTNNKSAEAEVVRFMVELRDQGFYVKFTIKTDKSKPYYTILATDPKEGALVARGTTLNLTVSSINSNAQWLGFEKTILESFLKEYGLAPPRPAIKLDPKGKGTTKK